MRAPVAPGTGGSARRMIMSQMEALRHAGDPRALRICKLIAEELSKLDAERRDEGPQAIRREQAAR